VRVAGIRDEPAILALLEADIAENATAVAPASIRRILSQIEFCTRGKGGFALVIDGDNGKPVAVALLHPTTWWWSDQIYLQEVVLYVSPEARNARCGRDLLEYEKWLSDEMTTASDGRVFLMAGVTGTKRLAAKERLYATAMHRVGAFMIYPEIGELMV
jgi:GNAT superfamily N-acetyltransferase